MGSSSEVPELPSWFQLPRRGQQIGVRHAMFNQSVSDDALTWSQRNTSVAKHTPFAHAVNDLTHHPPFSYVFHRKWWAVPCLTRRSMMLLQHCMEQADKWNTKLHRSRNLHIKQLLVHKFGTKWTETMLHLGMLHVVFTLNRTRGLDVVWFYTTYTATASLNCPPNIMIHCVLCII